jgi:DNA-binding transcriptional regulator YiaG
MPAKSPSQAISARLTDDCPACAASARAEQADARLAEAQAQLAVLQTHRAARKRRKAPDAPSADWVLVEEIRDLLHLSVGDLATRLGLAYSTVLGRAQERPLSPGLREKLQALKREHLAATTAKRELCARRARRRLPVAWSRSQEVRGVDSRGDAPAVGSPRDAASPLRPLVGITPVDGDPGPC